jgi:DNA-binding transcriptional MerR regulator
MAKVIPKEDGQEKLFYKIGEVCQLTDTQPYVLRFWESEFPQLAPQKTRSGQRIYRSSDIELVLRIKKLLYEEEFTIAGARKQLEFERGHKQQAPAAPEADVSDRTLIVNEIRTELQNLLTLLDEPVPGEPAEVEEAEAETEESA